MAIDSQPSSFSYETSRSVQPDSFDYFRDELICGEGASCKVYKLWRDGLRVAVKRLRYEYLTNPAYRASFVKEYNIGRSLKHESLPLYRELRADESEVYIIMDFIDGITLTEFLDMDEGQRYFCNAGNVKNFLSSLLNVVAYLHRNGIIHCDLKPDNIMFRNSDRGIMLIDLDKSYSDILERTHGGTQGISEPCESNVTPTVHKDFQAIGNIINLVASKVKGFPLWKFRRLQRKCANQDTTDLSLQSTLHSVSRTTITLITVIISLSACIATAVILSIRDTAYPANETISDTSALKYYDSAVKLIPSPAFGDEIESHSPNIPSEPSHSLRIIDFDKRMIPFIEEAEETLRVLSEGNVTDKQITDMTYTLGETYNRLYMSLLSDYKAQYHDRSPMEVELAVADAVTTSRTAKIRDKVYQALADTMRLRHPQSLDDFQ